MKLEEIGKLSEQEGKPKKMKQRNVKFTEVNDAFLEVICKFEGVLSVPALIRGWSLDRIQTYTRNPRFKRYLKLHPEDAEKIQDVL